MIAFYWLFQNEHEFLVALKIENKVTYHSSVESLKQALESVRYLITYGPSTELALLISGGKSKYLNQFVVLDVSLELGSKTIEEIGFYNDMVVRAKTKEEFCLNRIRICEFVFEERQSYFENKFEIIKDFKLKPTWANYTRARLAAEVLGAVKQPNRANVLMYEFIDNLKKSELPERLVLFYEAITKEYKCNFDESLVQKKMKLTLAGQTHTFGVGGVHAAQNKYKGEGLFLHIDVSSFFTTVMTEYDFITPAIQNKSKLKELHDKKVIEGKQSYKVLINAIVGSMKNPYSKLYDPKQFYSITINGQLMMAHLIVILEHFIEELVQTNTDGIVVKIQPEFEEIVRDLAERWAVYYHMKVVVTRLKRVIQRDVNNYIMVTDKGNVWRTGVYKEPRMDSGSLKIVSGALNVFHLNGTKPQDYIVQRFKEGKLSEFYYIASKSKDSEGIVQQIGKNQFVPVNDTVCGIATNKKEYGTLFQVKKDLHSKLPGCPDGFMNSIKATKKDLDVNWYVEQVEKYVF